MNSSNASLPHIISRKDEIFDVGKNCIWHRNQTQLSYCPIATSFRCIICAKTMHRSTDQMYPNPCCIEHILVYRFSSHLSNRICLPHILGHITPPIRGLVTPFSASRTYNVSWPNDASSLWEFHNQNELCLRRCRRNLEVNASFMESTIES